MSISIAAMLSTTGCSDMNEEYVLEIPEYSEFVNEVDAIANNSKEESLDELKISEEVAVKISNNAYNFDMDAEVIENYATENELFITTKTSKKEYKAYKIHIEDGVIIDCVQYNLIR